MSLASLLFIGEWLDLHTFTSNIRLGNTWVVRLHVCIRNVHTLMKYVIVLNICLHHRHGQVSQFIHVACRGIIMMRGER